MPNPTPRTDQLAPTQFRKINPRERLTRSVRVRLSLELADRYDVLTLEQRSALVAQALESFNTEQGE